jgi:hypothetical protein
VLDAEVALYRPASLSGQLDGQLDFGGFDSIEENRRLKSVRPGP